jgi:hypothetical protein
MAPWMAIKMFWNSAAEGKFAVRKDIAKSKFILVCQSVNVSKKTTWGGN